MISRNKIRRLHQIKRGATGTQGKLSQFLDIENATFESATVVGLFSLFLNIYVLNFTKRTVKYPYTGIQKQPLQALCDKFTHSIFLDEKVLESKILNVGV